MSMFFHFTPEKETATLTPTLTHQLAESCGFMAQKDLGLCDFQQEAIPCYLDSPKRTACQRNGKKRTTPRKCVLCNWSSIFIQSWPRKISRNHPEPLAQPASHRPRALGRGSCPWCAWEYCLTRRSLESNVMSSYGTFIFLHCLQRRRYQIDMFTVYIDLKISEDSQMCPCV